MPVDNLTELYEDLKREYDLTLDRRKTLTSQATSLISFAGIIETVLVALLITLATNKDARSLLAGSQYYPLLATLTGAGFLAYILTAVFSLLAFREPKWMRIPKMPDSDPLVSIGYFYSHADKYEPKFFAMQLSHATTYHQRTNRRKYGYLRLAFGFLLIGIVATAMGGLALLATVSQSP